MKKIFSGSLLVLLTVFLCSSCSGKNNFSVESKDDGNLYSCVYKGTERKISLWLPENAAISGMVFMLHGYGETINSFKNKTGMNDYALSEGYGVCYISSGNEPGWNSGIGVSKKDDYGFICSLIKYFQKEYNFSKEKTYLCGFSNGAFMVHYGALHKNPPFRGIIAVAGLAPITQWEKYKKNFSVDLFQVYGTKDDLVLSEENKKPGVSRGYPYIEDVIENWKKVNSFEFESSMMPGETSFLNEYYGKNNKMWVLQIKDYPHQWPESRSTGFDLSGLIMDFVLE